MIIHGDARAVLPTLDLTGSVVITDPPWASGDAIDIVGAGAPAESLWADVAALLGGARAVVIVQSSLDRPLGPPPLPFLQTCWLRSVPPAYRRCLRCQAMHEHLRKVASFDHWPNEALDCGHGYLEVHGKEPPPEIADLAFITAAEAQQRFARTGTEG